MGKYKRFEAVSESSVRHNPEKTDTSTKMNMSPAEPDGKRYQHWLLFLLLAIGLTMWFWLDLWLGGGLIGGDIYTYFMPQKSFYADSLHSGVIPQWNPLVGHGYPVIAESQTGVFYPANLLLYWLCDVNTAYNVIHLMHYVLAFMATLAVARELGLSFSAGALAAVVFVYGWFPPRCCLEWAITTGAYLPLCLWLLIRFQKTGELLWLWGLSGALALQLLLGHYNLAFITQLALATWVAISFFTEVASKKRTPGGFPSLLVRKTIFPGVAIACGLLLASMQLLPTWTMKQNSQRETNSSAEFDPGYGHIPPEYLSQIFLPWYWYADADQLDSRLGHMKLLASRTGTNKVEAHLYFGIIPLLLAIYGSMKFVDFRKKKMEKDCLSSDRTPLLILAGLGLFGVVYATGLLVPMMQYLPGFGFFRGPGRYGILTTLAVAMWAGYGLDQLLKKRALRWQRIVLWLVFIATVFDLSWVSQRVTYAFMVPKTPIVVRKKSKVRAILINHPDPARVFAPGPNLVTTIGVTATSNPIYLGIGPAEYFEPALMYPSDKEQTGEKQVNEEEQSGTIHFTSAQLKWLRQAAVTHILSFHPPAADDADLKLVWAGFDEFLNRAWGRQEPLYLSELLNSHRRADWETEQDHATREGEIRWLEYAPNHLVLEVESASNRKLILRDLYDQEWYAFLDGTPIESERYAGMFRAVSVPQGKHLLRWEYHSHSFKLGKWISIATLTIWLLLGARRISRILRRN